MKVLFVDDDPLVLKSLKRQMILADIEAVFFYKSKEALQYLEQQRVDIVVSDLSIPGIDGVDFLRQVQRLYPETLRAALTGANFKIEKIKRAYEDRTIEQWFSKPWEIDELISYFKKNDRHEQYSAV